MGKNRVMKCPLYFFPKGYLLDFSAVFSLLYPAFTHWGMSPIVAFTGRLPQMGGLPFQGFRPVRGSVRISLIEIYERVGKSVISACKKSQKSNRYILSAAKKSRKHFGFVIHKFFIDSGFAAAKRDVKF